MAKIVLKRGTKADLEKEPLSDGLLSFTTDDGKIHLDFINSENVLERKTFYGGKLTFGVHVYDGSEDVTVEVYDGQVEDTEHKKVEDEGM